MSEFQIILNISLEDTQKKLDKALKRNLEGQTKATPSTQTTVKQESGDLPVEEPISEAEENLEE